MCRGQGQRSATQARGTWGEVPYLWLVRPSGWSALASFTTIGAVRLTERDRELGGLQARADDARAGRGRMVMVCGESGAGKTSFVESFVERWVRDERVLWGACDPLPTPRPLGPIHDLAHRLAQPPECWTTAPPYDIFAALYDDLCTAPSVLVLDDLHWADQGTIDLLRFVLRRVSQTRSLIIGMIRGDEVGANHPMRELLGDMPVSACRLAVDAPAQRAGGPSPRR